MARPVTKWPYCVLTAAEWIAGSDSEGRAWKLATRASLARPGVEVLVFWSRDGLLHPQILMGTIVTDP